jgi:lipase maturation factor 1
MERADALMFQEFTNQPPPLTQRWFAAPAPYIAARWWWLRALGLIFFSAFYSLWFQIHGLIGPNGILPAGEYLVYAKQAVGAKAYWLVPSLLWFSASRGMLTAIVVVGLAASLAITFDLWPRLSIAIAGICFLSFVAAAQDFSAYQSDGMLLEAATFSLFLAPRGLRPGRGTHDPPTRAAVFLLQWEWFRIYFESGLVKILSGEEQWRNLTAMDKYYENGPLPSWLGWYVQQWPHAFHAASAAATLLIELFVVWLLFIPSRRARLVAFAITTPLQIGIILTANYAFLNYLVLALGILLVEDRAPLPTPAAPRVRQVQLVALPLGIALSILTFLGPGSAPAQLVAPSRIINNYGLFAVMTRARYEIEFQGTSDGKTWIAYPFRYKPQDPRRAPGIFAPYQPRFDWNLWFASLGSFSENAWVVAVEQRLMANDRDVLQLFAGNPFASSPPRSVRAVVWQYWFTTPAERARTGAWWNRRFLGDYAPAVSR